MNFTEIEVEVTGKFVTAEQFEIDTLITNTRDRKVLQLSKLVSNLHDLALRKALIELGWTPPPD